MKIFNGPAAMARLNQLSQYSNAVIGTENCLSSFDSLDNTAYLFAFPYAITLPSQSKISLREVIDWGKAQEHHPSFQVSSAVFSSLMA